MKIRSLALLTLVCVALSTADLSRAAESNPAAKPEAPAAATEPAKPLPIQQDPKQLYGFKLTRAEVASDKIIAGGPGRGGIHAIDAPTFAGPEAADAIGSETPVLGISIGGDARAYLLPILEYHQVINDSIGGVPIVVTYDPLTGAPLAWKRSVDGRTLRFGVSGLLYNSGFLLYDHETESLWSQFDGRALAGPLAGKRLEAVALRQGDFASWHAREPKTRILIPPDPGRYDYNESPYAEYAQADASGFPIEARDRRFHAKELTVGVVVNGKARAYLASLVSANGGRVEDELEGTKIVIRYDKDRGVFEWDVPADSTATESYWFAWKAFHPDTTIWNDPGTVKGRAP